MSATSVAVIQHVVAALVAGTVLVAAPAAAAAQSPLSLSDAIARSTANNPDAKAVVVAEREAADRATQTRAEFVPRVRVEESWQRSDQPAFVFSSRLAQRQLTPADFGLEALAHPP